MNRLLFALAGPIVWFLVFSALYAIETLACTPGAGTTGTSYGAAAAAAFVVAGLLLAAIAVSQFVLWRRERDWLARLGLLLTGLSGVATVWTALPVWLMRSCGG